jgi:acetylornithine/succinyldiaminopimelate/putrescine aminotransferase
VATGTGTKLLSTLTKKLNQLINVPHTYTIKNSHEVAEELSNIQTNKNNRIFTSDIKDL